MTSNHKTAIKYYNFQARPKLMHKFDLVNVYLLWYYAVCQVFILDDFGIKDWEVDINHLLSCAGSLKP